ncbi:MAG: aldo/keto reductase, partial [Spirochaetaceae bacterium]|nr:aldo/keto reductase [Spirochaetaceae bacterium]
QATGLSYTNIAIGYLLSHSFPSIAIVGSHTTAQIEDVMAAADVRLSPDQMNQLEVE